MPDIVTAERLVGIEAQAEASRKHRGVYWNGDIPDLCATVRKLERELAECEEADNAAINVAGVEHCELCGRTITGIGEHYVKAECLVCGLVAVVSTKTGRCKGCSPNPTPGDMPRYDRQSGKVSVPAGWKRRCTDNAAIDAARDPETKPKNNV